MTEASAIAGAPEEMVQTDARPSGLGPVLTVFFAFACGALAANLYYAQPLVALIGEDTGLSVAAESAIVTVAQIGYAIGLVLLVPLGDVVENRRLILITMAANLVALAGLALAPGLTALFAAMLFVGVSSTAAQMLVPLAANLAPPNERGAVVGNVMSGLLAGILLARPAASFLADYVGWRGVFGLSEGFFGSIVSGVSTLASVLFGILIGTIILYLTLADANIWNFLARAIPLPREHAEGIVEDSFDAVRGYFKGQTLIGLTNLFGTWFGLAIIGVPSAFAIGIVTFITSNIPYIVAFAAGAFYWLAHLVGLTG